MVAFKRKLVTVGHGACGKTSLVCVFVTGKFPAEYEPTIVDHYAVYARLDEGEVELGVWVTAGQDEYEPLRATIYPGSDVILVCYSIDIPESLENVLTKWAPEVKNFCPGLPIILVGCKKDLRNDSRTIDMLQRRGQTVVSPEQGQAAAYKIGAHSFHECSALTCEGVEELFELAARATLIRVKPPKPRTCVIM